MRLFGLLTASRSSLDDSFGAFRMEREGLGGGISVDARRVSATVHMQHSGGAGTSSLLLTSRSKTRRARAWRVRVLTLVTVVAVLVGLGDGQAFARAVAGTAATPVQHSAAA